MRTTLGRSAFAAAANAFDNARAASGISVLGVMAAPPETGAAVTRLTAVPARKAPSGNTVTAAKKTPRIVPRKLVCILIICLPFYIRVTALRSVLFADATQGQISNPAILSSVRRRLETDLRLSREDAQKRAKETRALSVPLNQGRRPRITGPRTAPPP